MDQCPACCPQRLVIVGAIEEIALAGRTEALSPVARVYLQHVATDDSVRGAPLANGQRDGGDIAGGAKMGADSAALGAKLLQLMFGQEADQTSYDRLRIGVRIMHI